MAHIKKVPKPRVFTTKEFEELKNPKVVGKQDDAVIAGKRDTVEMPKKNKISKDQ